MTHVASHSNGRRTVPDLPAPWPHARPAYLDAATAVLRSGEWSDYAYGELVRGFEIQVARYHQRRFCLSTSSGTSALQAGYVGLGLAPGDEAIVPTYSFHATVAPLFMLGVVPVLCDVEADTGNIDVADAASRVTERTKAVVVTHMWGLPVDVAAVTRLCRTFGLALVDDCSHAHGARVGGRVVGSFGDVAVMSLGGRKMVTGGCGGALLTDSEETFHRALPVGHAHERAELHLPAEDVAVGLGANFRMSPVAAAICAEQFNDLDARIAVKTSVLDGLGERLLSNDCGLTPPVRVPGTTRGGWFGYKALMDRDLDADLLDTYVSHARARGVVIDRPSNKPLHWRRMFRTRSLEPSYYRLPQGSARPLYDIDEFDGANRFYRRSVSFPAVHLHEPCDGLLDEYVNALTEVAHEL
jgi:dTDP-4-amino-4,6-dideoxygalactose transaminase